MPLVGHFNPSYSGASQIGARDANDCDTFSSEASEVVRRFYADVESGVDYATMVEANGRPTALLTILGGGLIAATLDGLDAIVYYKLANDVAPYRIFQHIAGGLLGPSTFNGGAKTVLLGLFLHYFIATGAAAVFYLACLRWRALYQKPWIFGPLFGLCVFLVMHFIVVPLSAIQHYHLSMPAGELADQLFTHMFFVGSSIALMASFSARRTTR
jgi:uncharacterized membrane protein YagU involved in acid resistance